MQVRQSEHDTFRSPDLTSKITCFQRKWSLCTYAGDCRCSSQIKLKRGNFPFQNSSLFKLSQHISIQFTMMLNMNPPYLYKALVNGNGIDELGLALQTCIHRFFVEN